MDLLKELRAHPELDARLGRFVYGNLCAFTLNFEGRRNLKKLRSDIRPQPHAAEFIDAMMRDGFYRFPHPLPSSLMESVVSAYQASLRDPTRSVAVLAERAQLAGIKSYCQSVSADAVPELNELLVAEARELVDAFFGGTATIFDRCARRTEHVPPEIAAAYDLYSNFYHCDNEASDRFKMFVALSDIGPDCGPLHLLSRSATRQVLKRGFKSRHDYGIPIQQIEDPQHLARFIGPIGSVIFVNVTQCLHRAGIPEPGNHRDIAEFQFRAG